MNATKIAWFSRHTPTPRQREALAQLFGPNVEIQVDARTYYGDTQIAARFSQTGAQELVLVAPLNVIRALTLRGIYPIIAVMQRCSGRHPEAEVHTRNLHYRFSHFERIEAVSLRSSPLTPTLKEPSCPSPTAPTPPPNATSP